jgi:hypothetical protein
MVIAWTLSILSGAAATALLRAPVGGPAIASTILTAHTIAGAAIAAAVVWHLARSRQPRSPVAASLVAAAVASGWLASRSFSPFTVAGHAIAAFAALALLVEKARSVAWKTLVARTGSALLLFQIAFAAFVRHHVVGLAWHFLVGGVAATAILVPAVAVTQDESAFIAEKRAARWAIAALLTQALLGVALLMMVAAGTDNVPLWRATMNAHVLVGTLTVLAAAAFSHVLAAG